MIKFLRKVSILVVLLMVSMFVRAQRAPVDTVTEIVPVLYVVDSASFATNTAWVYKVGIYSYRYDPQQSLQSDPDSFIVRKSKFLIDNPKYYLFVSGLPSSKPNYRLASEGKKVSVLVEFTYGKK